MAVRTDRTPSLTRVLAASLIGNALEWYDYIIYGLAAALVFPELFFPGTSEVAGTMASFATFAAGFLVRPIGGAIAGHFGDRIGRKKMLIVTVLVMGGSSTLIGVLPTHDQIGYWAAVLLVIMRLAQGLAIGGEWSGAILLAIEQSRGERKTGLLGSFPQAGNAVGLLLATGAFTLVTSTANDEQMLGWAWRLPFLASVVLLVIGVWLRGSLTETPQFEKLVDSGAGPERLPLLTVLRSQPRNFLLSMGSRLGVDISFYVFTVYAISYGATALDMPSSRVQIGLLIGAAVGIFTAPFFGAVADRFGVRRTYIFGLVFIGAFAFPFFAMLGAGNTVVAWLALVLAYAVGIMAGWAPFAAFLARLFPARVRYSGTAFSFQLAGILGGAFAPTIGVALYAEFGTPYAVATYLAIACAISIVCSLLVRFVPDDSVEEIREKPSADARA
jgi:MFS transporter, MHS family, shikimate and dehydroshikimate transport protein